MHQRIVHLGDALPNHGSHMAVQSHLPRRPALPLSRSATFSPLSTPRQEESNHAHGKPSYSSHESSTSSILKLSMTPDARLRKASTKTLNGNSKADSIDGALCEIIREYNKTIASLATLTAELPKRLHVSLDVQQDSQDAWPQSKYEMAKSKESLELQKDTSVVSGLSQLSQEHGFKLLPEWQASSEDAKARNMFLKQNVSKTAMSSYYISEDDKKAYPCMRTFITSPTHPLKVAWELLGLVLVLYDLISIPTILAFRLNTNRFLDFMDVFELSFWTINIPLSLTTGYFINGAMVKEPYLIFTNYLKTWCAIDVITLVPDWMYTISHAVADETKDDDTESYVKFLRAMRFLRLTRLARMIKLGNAWNLLHEKIYSEKIGILFGVLKMLLLLMMVNHLNACLWFVIGSNNSGKTWLTVHKYTADDVEWTYQYMVAYHWSLTLFTPASMDVQPQNLGERIFTVFVVLIGLVGFSSLVGRITGSMARLHQIGEEKKEKFSLLRKYLKKRNVGQELCIRIRTYLENRWALQQDVQESNVVVLDLLSENLKAELACAIHGPSLTIHPIFNHVQLDSAATMRRLMLNGVHQMSLAPQDLMFNAGEEGTHMSMVTVGLLHYYKVLNLRTFHPEVHVHAHTDWIAEPVLWVTSWHHFGDLKAATFVEVLHIIPKKFLEIAGKNVMAFKLVSQYAVRYVQWLNCHDRADLSDITHGSESLYEELRGFTNAPPRRESKRKMTGLYGKVFNPMSSN